LYSLLSGQSAAVTVAHSRRWTDFEDYLIPRATWAKERERHYAQLGLPLQGEQYLVHLRAQLAAVTAEVERKVPGNSALAIDAQKGEFHLAALKGADKSGMTSQISGVSSPPAINGVVGNDQRVAFDLINEPHTHAESGNKPGDIGISLADWFTCAQAAIDAIRAAGATNTIFVPGMAYTDADSFTIVTGALPSNKHKLNKHISLYVPGRTEVAISSEHQTTELTFSRF
jgi:cellulase (glycosyl hydrolase family 5)